jgi:hypothetical protein
MKHEKKKMEVAMPGIPIQLLLVVVLGWLPMQVHALNCSADGNAATYSTEIGTRHHPIRKPLPQSTAFNQPTRCDNDVWFFDLNQNARPDPDEPRLFGPQRVIECSSCHGDAPDTKSKVAADVFLRQDPSVLCLVCHNL